ncbi:hypothetical protein C9374_002459 [Naegleria lovaniensis]|uniref:Chromo domain-containing protein n=1 Tax=Naegleria lovaniensis TaxID=51637 RepID=A0AA88GTQ3_NAELO|nr:uncharacterized protein C9374_002459 [Naegleria lovaniensis]KAG2386715.1 hypothetical protein C9374_002459 [Naegleria lovaniensis]
MQKASSSLLSDLKKRKELVAESTTSPSTCLSDSDDDDVVIITAPSPSMKKHSEQVPPKKIRKTNVESDVEMQGNIPSASSSSSVVMASSIKTTAQEEENFDPNTIQYHNTNTIDTILKRKRFNDGKMKYFVKLSGQSHWHCKWMSREEVQENATVKLMWFEEHYGRDMEIDLFHSNWEKIEQIIANNGNYFLIKWMDVPYSGCTWESKSDILKYEKKTNENKATDLYNRFIESHRKKSYKILSEAELLSRKRTESQRTARGISKMSVTNVEGHNFELFDYQLQGVAWMRSMWIHHKSCLLCDQHGLGKTTQAISFLRAMSMYHNVPGPFLIISPRNRIEHWKKQITFWAPDLRVAVYDGLLDDRKIIKQFIIQTIQKRNLTPTDRLNFSVNIILTTIESIVNDETWFKYFLWPIAVIDEAHVLKKTKSNLFLMLKELKIDFTLFISDKMYNSETCGPFISLLNSNSSIQDFPKELLLRRERQDVLACIKPRADLLLTVNLTPLHKYFFRQIFKKRTYFNALTNVFKSSDTPQQYSSLFQQMFSDILRTCEHPYLQFFLEKEEPFAQNNELFMKYFIQSSSKLVLLEALLQRCKPLKQKVLILSSYPYVIEELIRFKEYQYQLIVSNESTNNATTNTTAPIVIMSTQLHPSIDLLNFDTIIVMDSAYHPIIDSQQLTRFCKIDKRTTILRLVCCEEFETMILNLSENEMIRGMFLKQLSEFETSLRIFAKDLFTNNSEDSTLSLDPLLDELTSQEGLEFLQSMESLHLSESILDEILSEKNNHTEQQQSQAYDMMIHSSAKSLSHVKITHFQRKENPTTSSVPSLGTSPSLHAEIDNLPGEMFWTRLIKSAKTTADLSLVKMEHMNGSNDHKRKDTTAMELSLLHYQDETMDRFFEQFLNSSSDDLLYSEEEIQQYSETVANELSDNLNALMNQVEELSATLKTVKDVTQRKKISSNIRALKYQIEDETIQLKIIERQLTNPKIKIFPNHSVSVLGFTPTERMMFVATLWRYGLGFPTQDQKWYEFFNILRRVSNLQKTLKQVTEFGIFMLDHFSEQVDQRYSHYSDGTPTDRLNNVKILQRIACIYMTTLMRMVQHVLHIIRGGTKLMT